MFSITNSQVTQEWVRRYNDTSTANWTALSVKADTAGFLYVLAGAGNNFGFLKYNSSGSLLFAVTHWPGGYDYGSAGWIEVTPNGTVYTTGIVGINFNYWIYTVKFNSSGVFQWGRLYNPDNVDSPSDLKLDQVGNIIIVGGAVTGGTNYALTLKYNTNGDTLWTRYFNLPPNYPTRNEKVIVDNSNNSYITGTIVRPGVPGKTLALKYDANGTLQWYNTFSIDSTQTNVGHGISLDNFGNIYILAVCNTSSLFRDYLLKLTNNGNMIWRRTFSGIRSGSGGYVSGIPRGPAISPDGSFIYYTTEAANAVGGGSSIATIKYNSVGDSQWVRIFNGGTTAGENRPGNIKLDKYDNLYLCGNGNFQTTGDDFLTIRYSPSGVQQWVMTYTGIVTTGGEGASDLFIDTSLNVYVTGNSPNTLGGRAAVLIKYNQPVGIISNNNELPGNFKLYQNYPNPFNQFSIINYQLPVSSDVSLKVYDVTGKEITVLVNETQRAGNYSVRFDAVNLASGIYLYRLIVRDKFAEMKKLILIK